MGNIHQLLLRTETGVMPKAGQIPSDPISSIKTIPQGGRPQGPVIALISEGIKKRPLVSGLKWVPIAGGFIAMGQKQCSPLPLATLKNEGATAVLTILPESVSTIVVSDEAGESDIKWIYFPFLTDTQRPDCRLSDIFKLYLQLQSLLEGGRRIYIHCINDIAHARTTIYGLLRYLGYTTNDALQNLYQLHRATALDTDSDQLIWANQFAVKRAEPHTGYSFADYNEQNIVDYFSWHPSLWPFSSENDALTCAYFQLWAESMQRQFPHHELQFHANESIAGHHYNFFSIVIRKKEAKANQTPLVFMINKRAPLAVWGTMNSQKPVRNAKWYILPVNIYNRPPDAGYGPVIYQLTSELQSLGLHFTPKEILLRNPGATTNQLRYFCINIHHPLNTLYGCTYNVYEDKTGLLTP